MYYIIDRRLLICSNYFGESFFEWDRRILVVLCSGVNRENNIFIVFKNCINFIGVIIVFLVGLVDFNVV